MEFDLQSFVSNPDANKLKNLTKIDWISLAKWYKIEYNASEKKAIIQNRVVVYLLDKDIISDEGFLHFMVSSDVESESDDGKETNMDTASKVEPRKKTNGNRIRGVKGSS